MKKWWRHTETFPSIVVPAPGDPGLAATWLGVIVLAMPHYCPAGRGTCFWYIPGYTLAPACGAYYHNFRTIPAPTCGAFRTNPARSRPLHTGHLLQTLHCPGPDMRGICSDCSYLPLGIFINVLGISHTCINKHGLLICLQEMC